MKQIDMFVDAEDRALFARVKSQGLQIVAERLPSKPLLSPSDVAVAIDRKVDTVYRWIDSGLFEYINLGSGEKKKKRYSIVRASFLAFMALVRELDWHKQWFAAIWPDVADSFPGTVFKMKFLKSGAVPLPPKLFVGAFFAAFFASRRMTGRRVRRRKAN